MEKEKGNIINLILKNKRVNNYTKLMILLNTLNYYEDYYIPNRKLMNLLKVNKKNIIRLLHQLEDDKIIKIFYKSKKRFFIFIGFNNEISEKNEIKSDHLEVRNNIFDYDWLNEN